MKIIADIINPALEALAAYKIPPSDKARVMLYAIGLQESLLKYRWQILNGGGKGPARGLWQFERGGGVKGVLNHKKSAPAAHAFALQRVKSTDPQAVWEALEFDDFLAAIFARLLLWTDPRPLPEPALEEAPRGWGIYNGVWRPGKPGPDKWPRNWDMALAAVAAAGGPAASGRPA